MTCLATIQRIVIYLLLSFIPASVTLYTASDRDFAVALQKGTRLLEKLESGCEPDTVNPVDIEALRAVGYRIGTDEKSQWPPEFNERSVFTPDQAQRFKWSYAS
ncbi:MAG: hypothetical protein Q9224_001411, partial [Gallowayella concinna]